MQNSSKLPTFFVALCCVWCVSGQVFGQQISVAAATIPQQTSAVDKVLENYQLVHINADKLLQQIDNHASFEIKLPDGQALQVAMDEVQQLAPAYALRVEDDFGTSSRGNTTIRTFQGEKVAGFGASLTISENFIQGQLPQANGLWYIEPAQKLLPETAVGTYLLYKVSDIKADTEHVCGFDEKEAKAQEFKAQVERNQSQQRVGGQCIKMDLAIASDFEMFTTYGSVAATEAFIVGVINDMETDYQGFFQEDVDFTIVEQYVSTSASTTLETALTSTTTANTLLSNFNTWGQSANGFTIQTYDLSQIWVERDIVGNSSAAVGVARLPGVCTQDSRVAVFENFTATAWQLRVLASHETGHNFGIFHDPSGAPFIMAPSVTNTTAWSAQSAAQFEARVSATACVDGTYELTGSPKVNFLVPTQVCIGQQVNVVNQSGRNPGAYSWTLTGGTPSSSSATNPSVSYATAGTKSLQLSTSNTACGSSVSVTGTETLTVITDTPPATASCTPSSSNISTTAPFGVGLANVTFAGINNTTGDAGQTGISYTDWSCQFIGTSSTNSISFSATIINLNTQTVEVYIDVNNDGVFASGEEFFSQTVAGVGGTATNTVVSGTLSIPGTAVQNQILRTRVLSVLSGSGAGVNGCTNADYQEVEDYGLTLSVPLPVDLLSFVAKPKKTSVDLNWRVANEFDLHGYELEYRSATGDWEGIASLEAKQLSEYRYTHLNRAPGTHYYRLVSIDNDGSQAESDIVVVTLNGGDEALKVFPNPLVQGMGTLQLIDWGSQETVSIRVFDLNGRIVRTWNSPLASPRFSSEQLDLTGLLSGLYTLEVRGAQKVKQTTIRL